MNNDLVALTAGKILLKQTAYFLASKKRPTGALFGAKKIAV